MMTTMKALTYTKQHGIELCENYPVPRRDPGEALVKLVLAGICKTDLEITAGYQNFSGVVGHEFLGKIVEIEENDKSIKVGDTVCGEINLVCGSCHHCEIGGDLQRNHCTQRRVLGIVNKDGTFAEYLTLPITNLFVVPPEIPDIRAVFAEPLAAAFRIVEQGLLPTGSKVALIGDGRLGFLISEVLGMTDCDVTVIGKHEDKMALMPSKITKHVLDEETSKTFSSFFDVVVEASGCASGLILAGEVVRPLGTIVLKSTFTADSSFSTAIFVVKEIKIFGSRCGNFQMALDALKTGSLNPEKIINKIYTFQYALEALAHAGRKGTMKVLLEFN